MGTGTNYLENDTSAHTTLYFVQVEGACGLFGNSIDTGNIAANISGSNCDHMYIVEDELLSNCGHHNCCQVNTPSESVPSDKSLAQTKDPYKDIKTE